MQTRFTTTYLMGKGSIKLKLQQRKTFQLLNSLDETATATFTGMRANSTSNQRRHFPEAHD